ncbi:hypothetical protein KP509_14G029300 [Ceratopteris richardii]|uniref:Uncharacterized protein n=1 Tax=Ceratopteris richardii TaxID=49495 RepID=A0A8T2T8H7_CERRI|nr:hypothetical protein KP509_14G029300 [Ceratopteris richardii]
MTYTRSTGFMPAELMYCQKPIFPIQTQIVTWLTLPWNDGMTREELLSLRIKQLEQGNEKLKEAVQKLKESRLKNKIYFDKTHRLRPRRIEIDDWVLVYDSTFDTQYDAKKKLTKRWFGPYVVMSVFENDTYALRELDGTPLRSLIARKRIKLFKKRNEADYEIEQELLEDTDDAGGN